MKRNTQIHTTIGNDRRVIPVKAMGTRHFGEYDFDGWMSWVLFKSDDVSDLSDEDIICILNMYPHYAGVGMEFADPAHIHRTKRCVLVTQRGGYDV